MSHALTARSLGEARQRHENPSLPAFHVHRVSMRFGQVEALRNINFDLPAGETLAIVGPNGAGKSTLVKIALGLMKPNAGHAAIFGKDAGKNPERIGYVPQLKTFDRTFPATVLELVVSGLRRTWPAWVGRKEQGRACGALEQVGAERLLKRSLASLSGGELQRAFLARALVRSPDIVLLDEPATGVDFLAEHDLYDLLERYQQNTGATVVMVTHDLSAAKHHAGFVAVINRELHGFGRPHEVLTERCLKSAYGHVGHGHEVLVL